MCHLGRERVAREKHWRRKQQSNRNGESTPSSLGERRYHKEGEVGRVLREVKGVNRVYHYTTRTMKECISPRDI